MVCVWGVARAEERRQEASGGPGWNILDLVWGPLDPEPTQW